MLSYCTNVASLHTENTFIPNWKHCSFSKSYPDILPISTPSTILHSRLTVCLPDSLDLDPLPIDFVLVKRLWISWFLRLSLLWVL